MPIGHLLQALLEDDVAVGHLERFGVAHVHLVLAEAPLALASSRPARPESLQMPAHRCRDMARSSCPAGCGSPRGTSPPASGRGSRLRGRRDSCPEEVVLELRGGHRGVARPRCASICCRRSSAARSAPARVFDASHVAQHQRGLLEPARDGAACRGPARGGSRRSPAPSSRTGSPGTGSISMSVVSR